MTRHEHVGTMLRQARTSRRMSLRQMEEASKELAERNPRLYESVSRNFINRLELDGDLIHTAETQKVRTIIDILFGSPARFTERTGIDVHLSAATTTAIRLPVYKEGNKVSLYDLARNQGGSGTILAESAHADLALIANTDDLSPVVFAGQTVQVKLSATAEGGELAVLHYGGLLRMAYCADPKMNLFATLKKQAPAFSLSSEDCVVGIVQCVVPRIPVMHLPKPQQATAI